MDWHLEYDVFGSLIAETDTTDQFTPRQTYTGQIRDDVTGLMYYDARWFDPSINQFISEDPIGFAAGDANLRRYVGNSNPNATDPSGLWTRNGVMRAFRERYGNDRKAMAGLQSVLAAGYSIEQGSQLWHHDWDVDHGSRKIYISDDSGWLFEKSNENAAAQLYQALSDELFEYTELPESWGGLGRRIGGAGLKTVGGGFAATGGAVLCLAPEPILTKVGGGGAVVFGTSTFIDGVTSFGNRRGGFNPANEGYRAYVGAVAGREPTATEQAFFSGGGMAFELAGGLGHSPYFRDAGLKQVCADGYRKSADTLTRMSNSIKNAPNSVDNLVGRMGGELYGRQRLGSLTRYLERRGIDLRIGKSNSFKVFPGDKRPVLTLKRNPTEYEVWHELSHYLHFNRVGKSQYLSYLRRPGVNIPEAEVFRSLAGRWNKLNAKQQQHAIEYLRDTWGMEVPWHLLPE